MGLKPKSLKYYLFFMSLQIQDYPSITVSNPKTTNTVHITKGFCFEDKTNTILSAKKDAALPMIHLSKNKNIQLIEILFHGLNLSAKRTKRKRPKFQVDVHKSEIFICHQKIDANYSSRIHKRRILLYVEHPAISQNITHIIKQFKIPDTYTGKGLFTRNQSYHVKKGKENRK